MEVRLVIDQSIGYAEDAFVLRQRILQESRGVNKSLNIMYSLCFIQP